MADKEKNNQQNIIEKPEKTKIDFVLLSMCTCKRPKMLREALLSIDLIKLPRDIRVEVLVIDNDESESAKKCVEEISKISKCKIHYLVEKRRGIAFARNKMLEGAIVLGASHILCFDDDEVLDENCLIEHINFYNTEEKVYISSGPAYNKFSKEFPKYITDSIVFKQSTSKETGLVRKKCATNNVFFPVSIAKDYGLRFSTEYIFMGGEDGDFFHRATDLGFTIVWKKEAIIYEMVTSSRANLDYILAKSYYNGYSVSLLKLKNPKKRKKRILYILKFFILCILNGLILIPSIFLGVYMFFKTLEVIVKTKGKLDAMIKNKPIDFYKDIYGE